MSAPQNTADTDELTALRFKNSYDCSECGTAWTDSWSCMCDDRCPECNAETEPTSSIDLSRPVTEEDYLGASRLISRVSGVSPTTVSSADAKAYAEAMLEGGEHRFSHPTSA
jgi:hypothetical protein